MKRHKLITYTSIFLTILFCIGCEEEEQFNFDQNGIVITPASGITEDFNILFLDYPSEKDFGLALYNEAKTNITVEIGQNNLLVSKFNQNNGTAYSTIPEENVSFSSTEVPIEIGSKSSDTLKLSVKTTGLDQEKLYLLPVEIKNVSSDEIVLDEVMNVKYFVAKAGVPPNIALNKATSQSSVVGGGISSKAVDGNTSGQWGNGSVTHTGKSGEEWLQVDLGAISPFIQEIKLYNRQDCCGERLIDFYVFVSDEPFASEKVADVLEQDNVFSYYHEGVAEYETVVPVNRMGRYIRVQLTGETNLALAEIQVFGIQE